MDRNRYADLLRVLAMGAVVYGHWLLTDVTYSGGHFGGLDAMGYLRWWRWGTLLFQVVPIFFLVGGYANARSWTAHAGNGWAGWVRRRAFRLLGPTTVYVAVAVLAVVGARAVHADPATLAAAGRLVALQLWFLPVYLLLIVLTPALLAAHRRWGLAVPVVMAAAAALVDVGVIGHHLPVVGFANYLLVWGTIHQLGFAWQDGRLARWRPYALAVVGALALAGLLHWGPFPVDMIGDGERVTNTTPPSIALLAFGAVQAGVLLALEPAVSRPLKRPGPWRAVTRLNDKAMTVYLWHMAPVIIIAIALYPTGLVPQPAVATADWWALRLAWFVLLTEVLILVVMAFAGVDRLPLPTGTTPAASVPILLAGLAAVSVSLARLAIAGFAPGGQLPVPVLVAYAAGLVGVAATALFSRRKRLTVPSGTGP
jgi:peptidoglycan/LPS O-acetylase OafA/YrhL